MEIVYDDDHPRRLHRARHRGVPRAPGARRPVPRRRHRDRRGRPVRRRGTVPGRRDGTHRGSRRALRRLLLRTAADHVGPHRPGSRAGVAPRRSRGASACAACSTCSTRSRTTCCTCWRPTRGRRARCRSCPRRRPCRWPRPPRGSCSAPPSRNCAPKGCCPPRGDGADLPPDAPVSVKEAVLPFHRFRTPEGHGVDSLLGPEMKSTGEVMGIDYSFGKAFAKSQTASYGSLPTVRPGVRVGRQPGQAGHGVPGQAAGRPRLRGARHRRARRRCCAATGFRAPWCASTSRATDNIVDQILAGEVDIVINTPYGNHGPRVDGYEIRTAAVARDIPCITTDPGCRGRRARRRGAHPGRRRRPVTAGAAGPAAEGVRDGTVRRPAGRRRRGARAVVRRHRPASRAAGRLGPARGRGRAGAVRARRVEALAGEIAVVKPQSAFFEAYGSGGIAVLERVVEEARAAGAIVILDVEARRHRLDDGRVRGRLSRRRQRRWRRTP